MDATNGNPLPDWDVSSFANFVRGALDDEIAGGEWPHHFDEFPVQSAFMDIDVFGEASLNPDHKASFRIR